MPTIPLQLLDGALYLYSSRQAAEAGQEAGGSGFVVVVPLPGYRAGTFYAVTNSHVVAGGFTTIRLNTLDGRHTAVELCDQEWIRHPEGDDVALAEIALSSDFRYSAVSIDQFIDGFDVSYFNVGQEVVMIGRYVTHEGKQRNLPTARFGHVAQLPYERIRMTGGIEQAAFLVDMRSLSGYSGSAVFVYRDRPDLDDDPATWVKSFELRFLAVDFGHLPAFGKVLDENRQDSIRPRMWSEQNPGVSAVLPAWRLLQLINDEGVVAERARREEEWLEEHGDDPAMKLRD